MPAWRQSHLPGHALHVIQRGRLRATCFAGEDDRLFYLDSLARNAVSLSCALHAYVLMGNHVHLLLTPARADGVTRLMACLAEHHERYLRDRHEYLDDFGERRDATLWEKGFKTTAVHVKQYLLACMSYIELNPVRAGLVTRPQAYRWSSFRANALGTEDTMLTPHAHYCALGRTPTLRQAAYRAMFKR